MWLKRRAPRKRLIVIGLDCAEPSLMFERFADSLPTFTRLRNRGLWGKLESIVPAITVPAWSCMMSGQDPGALGIYGFRNRLNFAYNSLAVADGSTVKLPRVWDILSQHQKSSVVLNVPGTYPPRPLRGKLVSCFLTPNSSVDFTFPTSMKGELVARFGDYPFDIKDFRTRDKDRLIADIFSMTVTHFEAARWLASKDDWDLFVMVEIGLDRMQHAFWRFMDSEHKHYQPNTPYANAILDYYVLLDNEVDRLLEAIGDDAAVMIVSDHGAKRMDGGICLNEWLIKQGYLSLAEPYPNAPTPFEALQIDWSRTQAWGEGGYYGRLFLNIRGREPLGIVAPEDANTLLNELSEKIGHIPDENNRPIGTRCFRPGDIYAEARGIPPDLMIYFGDLSWRSIGTVGWNRIQILENDTGSDDANHAQHGVYIYSRPQQAAAHQPHNAHLLQITPTVLDYFGIESSPSMRYKPI